ncbi:MAG: YraN family protein [Phycisphaeraceae bacterium]|nr:YraN family protein [Phycisphaeraceae bacterium]
MNAGPSQPTARAAESGTKPPAGPLNRLGRIAAIVLGWFSPRRMYLPHRTGHRGEQAACRHLRREGYAILARNVKLRGGELDIIALSPDGDRLVFVEVKSGTVGALASAVGVNRPEQHLTRRKLEKLRRLARAACRTGKLPDKPARIDLISVELDGRRVAALRHHRGVS